MGNMTWCDNCGEITNNNKRTGGYRENIEVTYGISGGSNFVDLCKSCNEEMKEELESVFNNYQNYEKPKSP